MRPSSFPKRKSQGLLSGPGVSPPLTNPEAPNPNSSGPHNQTALTATSARPRGCSPRSDPRSAAEVGVGVGVCVQESQFRSPRRRCPHPRWVLIERVPCGAPLSSKLMGMFGALDWEVETWILAIALLSVCLTSCPGSLF